MMWNSGYCDKILDGWERSETSSGIPYYINHNCEKTQWDHPLFARILEEIVEMNDVKYAAYRTAMKLRVLQKRLGLAAVDIKTILAVFDRHGYINPDTDISCSHLYAVLLDILSTTRYQSSMSTSEITAETLAEMLLNWTLNIYDSNRTGCVPVDSVKIGLATLCSCRLSEKYRYFFRHLSSSSSYVPKKKMKSFLQSIIQVPELINESAAFGGINVDPAVDSCFTATWNHAGITEDQLINWLLREPQTLVWLPTLHRLAAAETVKHESKCNICKSCPIIGFRYRCLKCFSYDMCQNCFFTGKMNKKHKLKHPTQEYCLATTTKEDTKDFMRTVRNNLSRKHCNKHKLRYLPIDIGDHAHSADELQSYNDEEVESGDRGSVVSEPALRILPPSALPPATDMENNLPGFHSPIMQSSARQQSAVGCVPADNQQYVEIIGAMEQENRQLMQDVEHLSVLSEHISQATSSQADTGSELIEEVEWLREEKERMGAQQEILESHNSELELQLSRLRMMLTKDGHHQPLSSLEHNRSRPLHPSLPALPPALPLHLTLPPYQGSPQKGAASQSLLLPPSFAHQSPSAIIARARSLADPTLTVPKEPHDTRWDSFDQLAVDTSYVTTDPALGRTHFALPSPDNSQLYPDEEAELEELMRNLDQVSPVDGTESVLHSSQSQGALAEMYHAASKIGEAFAGMVRNPHENEDGDTDETFGYDKSDAHGTDDFDTAEAATNTTFVPDIVDLASSSVVSSNNTSSEC